MSILFFTTGLHGSLSGNTEQTVEEGNNSSAVLAVPDENYHFVQWTGPNGFVSTENPLTITDVTEDATYAAEFAINKCIVTFSVIHSGGGTILGVTNEQEVDYSGSTTEVEAVPDENYRFVGWIGDIQSTNNPLIIHNVTTDLAVVALFKSQIIVVNLKTVLKKRIKQVRDL